MKTDIHKLENNKRQIEVIVDESEVANALQGAYKKVVAKLTMPGFRKGKVPVHILEARYGAQVLHDDALDILLPLVYERVLRENKIKPIDRPEVNVVRFERGQEAEIKFVVELLPEINVQDYKGVVVSKPLIEVGAEQVENELKTLAARHQRLVDSPDMAVTARDTAVIDYEGSVDGVPFAGGQAKGHSLEIGAGSFIPGFEEQVIGMERGQSKNIEVTFPKEYRNTELAGQDAVFAILLHDIKRKELPTLDDEFAKEVSEHETLDEMKAKILVRLQKTAENNARQRLENEIITKVVESTSFDIPKVLVEDEMDSMVEDMTANLSRSKLKIEQYLEYVGKTNEAFREDFRQSATNRVKTRLVLDKISELEGITIDDAEFETHIATMGQAYGQSAEDVEKILRERGQLAAVRASLVTSKTIDYLVQMSVAKEDQEVE